MTVYLLSSTTWRPLQRLTQNTYGLPGIYYPADTNLSVGTGELTTFCSSVPLTQVTPLMASRGVVVGPRVTLAATIAVADLAGAPSTEGGLTQFQARPGQTMPVFGVFTDQSPVGGILIHEWGHCTDSQFVNTYGAGASLTSVDPTITALWTRTTQLPSYDGSGHTYYGWVNIREYWAELYRYHWGGAEYGSNLVTGADQSFRQLISGTGATGPDDSFTVEMHTFIGALRPPYPPRLLS